MARILHRPEQNFDLLDTHRTEKHGELILIEMVSKCIQVLLMQRLKSYKHLRNEGGLSQGFEAEIDQLGNKGDDG